MTEGIPHHDSAAFLGVVWANPAGRGATGGPGWYVRRTCDCHKGAFISMRFATEAEAIRCLWALDADCRQTLARNAEAKGE